MVRGPVADVPSTVAEYESEGYYVVVMTEDDAKEQRAALQEQLAEDALKQTEEWA